MFSSLDWCLLFLGLIAFLLLYGFWRNSYFKRNGIKHLPNFKLFFGHMWNIFSEKEHFIEAVYNVYNAFPNEKYVGFYAFRSPIIILKDLELIRKVGVRDFDQFVDHRIFMDEESDPLFGRNLFFLRGQRWKDMRTSMSPAYTSSKLKNMFSMFVECAEQSVAFMKKESNNLPSEDDYIDIEMKDFFTRYTSDVIASTAFGVKVNSLEEKNNEFYKMGKEATNFSGIQFLKFLGYGSFPNVMKFFRIPLFSSPVSRFFRTLVVDTMAYREKENVQRPDMIHLLMQAKKGSLKHDDDYNTKGNDSTGFATIQQTILKQGNVKREWTNDDLTAQAMAFMLAGFDTSSSLLCFIAYELSLNPDIQKRLQSEIDEVMNRCENKLTYNDLMDMKYIDMVVSETLRKWPPDGHLDRLCANTYTLPPPNDDTDKNYVLYQHHDVWIPTYSIHHDAKYHPDPEKFDPERFSDENKSKLIPFTFIPFGVGPRFCIGARFAVLEAKVVIFHLLAHFDIVKTAKTSVPFKLARNTFIMHCQGGFWLGLKARINH